MLCVCVCVCVIGIIQECQPMTARRFLSGPNRSMTNRRICLPKSLLHSHSNSCQEFYIDPLSAFTCDEKSRLTDQQCLTFSKGTINNRQEKRKNERKNDFQELSSNTQSFDDLKGSDAVKSESIWRTDFRAPSIVQLLTILFLSARRHPHVDEPSIVATNERSWSKLTISWLCLFTSRWYSIQYSLKTNWIEDTSSCCNLRKTSQKRKRKKMGNRNSGGRARRRRRKWTLTFVQRMFSDVTSQFLAFVFPFCGV